MADNTSRVLCLLLVLLLASPCCSSLHSVLCDGREVLHVDGRRDAIVWVVQLTDLHISSYHPDRASSLQTLMGPLLALINPSLVLITGDLTDAKSKDLTSRRQDEKEWIQYRQAISKVIIDSGLPAYAFYDLRGNHDKFGVPKAGSRLDYFSKYSMSSLRNRTRNVQSITLKSSGWKHLFVGVDTSMNVGLRGPCNLFGHPSEEQLTEMDLELSQWDTCPPEKVTKLVFGHFPMSFTASTERGSRPEFILAKHSVAAYVCGHLHKSFGPNLINHHLHSNGRTGKLHECGGGSEDGIGEFWEWELGDWRMRRTLRIITIDQGHTAFVDFDVSELNASDHENKDWLPTFIVPTYPLDLQRMERSAQLPHSAAIEDVVRALVFSQQPLVSVIAKLYHMISGKPHLLEELKMHAIDKVGNTGYIYEARWNSIKYKDSPVKQYAYQVSTLDSAGKLTESSIRSFSIDRRVSELKKTWREFLVMGFLWEEAFMVLLWLAFASLVIFFLLPKFFLHFLLGNGRYERWSYCLFKMANQKLTARRSLELFIWFWLQGCAHNVLWFEQLFVLVWLIFFPWYWGQALADGHSLGFMSLRGWEVRLSDISPLSGLGWPDLMVIVLPYLYFVVLPLYTLTFALSAEASLHEIYQMEMPASLKKKERTVEEINGDMKSFLSCQGGDEDTQKQDESSFVIEHSFKWPKRASCRRVRLLLMGCCVILSFIHFGQVYAVAGAYGSIAVLASPGFAWPVPVLMVWGCQLRVHGVAGRGMQEVIQAENVISYPRLFWAKVSLVGYDEVEVNLRIEGILDLALLRLLLSML
ncbi:hypothetical protein GOP47_0029454 [Adiantum capillus-veneris]|nr:hypothetical protein GOP47_0029454 [Adiantum capillus-veneris]